MTKLAIWFPDKQLCENKYTIEVRNLDVFNDLLLFYNVFSFWRDDGGGIAAEWLILNEVSPNMFKILLKRLPCSWVGIFFAWYLLVFN